MSGRGRSLVGLGLVVLLGSAPARADDPDAPPSEPTEVAVPPAPSFGGWIGRKVVVVYREGGRIGGTLLAEEPTNVTLALDATGQVITIEKIAIADIVAPPPPPPVAPPPPPPPRPREPRYFGVHGGLPTFTVEVDLAVRQFYAFVSASALLPAISVGQGYAVAVGAGWTRPIATGWWLDLFALVMPNRNTGMNAAGELFTEDGAAVGIGLGFRYQSPRGFELGFKVPLLGANFSNGPINVSVGDHFGNFYAVGLLALADISLGYRF